MPNEPFRILILGGTAEARELAARLADDARFSPLTSLKGVTRNPSKIAGDIRTGGFGGVDGLVDFLREDRIALLADATHPFAPQISAHAVQAGQQTGVPCLRLERTPWEERSGDDWHHVSNIEEAVRAIPSGARVLVTVGRQEVSPFFAREDIHVVARMIEEPSITVPENTEILLARPPFLLVHEKALMQEKRISVLVAKNSGGAATYAKIEAARELGLPVIMIKRPQKAQAKTASSVDEVLDKIEEQLG